MTGTNYKSVRPNTKLSCTPVMGVAEGASGASADTPGVGLELVSVSFSHKKKGEKIKIWRKKRCFKQKKKEIER